jgi:hypothetical protein
MLSGSFARNLHFETHDMPRVRIMRETLCVSTNEVRAATGCIPTYGKSRE